MKFDREFKKAISNLPSIEKDKLIFRLLRRDLNLANRLQFELIDTATVDERREKMENSITKRVQNLIPNFYSLGYLMMDMRELSGEITEHVQITKDKYGEVSLSLLMLNKILINFGDKTEQTTPGKSYKFCIYVIARTFKILVLINALHEDYFIEFKDALLRLGEQISANKTLMKISIRNGLDINWLLQTDIPNNINEIHKRIKSQGFLK